ncbi:MAG: phosphoribosylformylglycinamidine synthase subunit PurS [Phycisphaeraceae bacterium]
MTTAATARASTPADPRRVHRVEVWTHAGQVDPLGDAALAEARAQIDVAGAAGVAGARVYLIEADLTDAQVAELGHALLADPVSQRAVVGVEAPATDVSVIEVHHKPGVMDPVAESTRDAVAEAIPGLDRDEIDVRTGVRYDLRFAAPTARPDAAALERFAQRSLANPVIEQIHLEPHWPEAFVHGQPYELKLRHVVIRELDDDALATLSRDGHLFLSLDEMQAIQRYYRDAEREPTDIELETLAQTWSEHCVHKTLKSTIHYRGPRGDETIDFTDRPGHEVHADGSVTIHNLLKSTVAAATHELMREPPHRDWCVSVFEDNAGIVRFDDELGVCIKVETHNHPSAIEPYGGAATGIGGCIRDILGTGLAARPVANTDTFCVAPPETGAAGKLPRGVIDPRRILKQVVAGVRDYGNRMGIPTVNGAVHFHRDYLGNPLVFAGCVGTLPLDKCFGDAKPGDRIIALGGATGRDGIHGATFSSAELTDTHADEFSHAVQIGNAITQRKVMDVILQARDYAGGPLFSAITDCGAGGFSSAVGEMGEKVGACVTLEQAPLKYAGLSYTEIWISEAQERMVLSVPAERIETLRELCASEDVSFADLGQFGCGEVGPTHEPPDEPMLLLTYEGTEVGRLAMRLLHEGIPTPVRDAVWGEDFGFRISNFGGEEGTKGRNDAGTDGGSSEIRNPKSEISPALRALLAHPNIASKHWIVRQYDHEVQGGSAIKPLVGPGQDGPGDAAVIRPRHDSHRGVALACGLAPHMSEKATADGLASDGDSYWATLAAIDEAIRNAVCVGADPERIALLDNFCWPRCDDPAQLGSLVRAAEACYDGAKAYRAPFVSGKDSLSNQFTTEDGRLITIPPTMLISAMGIVEDVRRCVTMDAKRAGNVLVIVGAETAAAMGGSHYRAVAGAAGTDHIPRIDLNQAAASARLVARLIAQGLVVSAHDCSEGGLLVAAAEMAFAGRVGLEFSLSALATDHKDVIAASFAETPGRYLLEVAPSDLQAVVDISRTVIGDQPVFITVPGRFADHDRLMVTDFEGETVADEPLDELRQTWLGPLDW